MYIYIYTYTLIVHIIVTFFLVHPPPTKSFKVSKRHDNWIFSKQNSSQKTVTIICSATTKKRKKRNDNLYGYYSFFFFKKTYSIKVAVPETKYYLVR